MTAVAAVGFVTGLTLGFEERRTCGLAAVEAARCCLEAASAVDSVEMARYVESTIS